MLSTLNSQLSTSNYGIVDLYAGERWVPELTVYDLRNRYMSPELGRFLQTDPIGFKGDAANLYRYCANDPIDKSDPMGLENPPAVVHGGSFWALEKFFDSSNIFQGGLNDWMQALRAAGMDGGDGGAGAASKTEAAGGEGEGSTASVRIENTSVWRSWPDYAHSDSQRDDAHFGDHKGGWLEGPGRTTGHAFVQEDGTVCPVVDTQYARYYAPGKSFGPQWTALAKSGEAQHQREISAAMSSRHTLERAQNAFANGGIPALRKEMSQAMSEAVRKSGALHDGPYGDHHLYLPQKTWFPYNRDPLPYDR